MKSIPLVGLLDLPDDWGIVAAQLLRVKQTGEWKEYAKSFSAYITGLSVQSKKSRSVFWKLLVAGRVYNSLLTEFDPKAGNFRRLEEVRHSPSPTSLELLDKISRVAPEDVIKDLREKTLKAEVGRDYLLPIWSLYRPLLVGKTKRGRGAPAPRRDSEDESFEIPLFEANALVLFKKAGPESMGLVHNPYLYRVMSVSKNPHIATLGKYRPDIIVLYAATQSDPVTIHGIEVRGSYPLAKETIEHILHEIETEFDFFWIATAEENFDDTAMSLPKSIGLLGLDNSLRVIRPAVKICRQSNPTEAFLKSLLRAVAKSRQ